MISFNWFRLQKALKTEQEEEEGGSKLDDVTKPETDVEDVKAEIELELKEDEKFEIEEKNGVSTHFFNINIFVICNDTKRVFAFQVSR